MKKLALCLLLTFTFVSSALALQEVSREFNTDDVRAAKDAVVSVVSPIEGMRIVQTDDYRVVFESPVKNGVANMMFMNLRTGVSPVVRMYYEFIPTQDRTLVKCKTAFVENPHMPNEIINWNMGNKNDKLYIEQILDTAAATASLNTYKPDYEANSIYEPVDNLGIDIDDTGEITSVSVSGRAHGKLQTGDFVLEVNKEPFGNIQKSFIDELWFAQTNILFTIKRNGEILDVNVAK